MIEVADTSAEFDRQIKMPRYARAGVADWPKGEWAAIDKTQSCIAVGDYVAIEDLPSDDDSAC